MNFTQHKINGCNCYDNGNFRIIQQKNKQIFNAYKVSSWDDNGKPTGYSSIQEIILGTELHPEYNELGEIKRDTNGKPIMKNIEVKAAKEYTTLAEAIASCVS